MAGRLDRYEELSRFLRTRRERITPNQAGLPESGRRRRTPGLRRSEVALLADVGLDWYTYLEQGRHINVSAEVLDRIAGALQLDESERRHLFHLARKQFPLIETEKPSKVTAALQHFLDSQNLSPSNVMDARMNIIAWNAAYCALNGDLTAMSERERNFVWMTFTSPRFRYIKGDQWELHARRIAANSMPGMHVTLTTLGGLNSSRRCAKLAANFGNFGTPMRFSMPSMHPRRCSVRISGP